ncbi:MAG: UDP-galactopyranose mutase [Candidatus Margulisbacteria bacterium GWF2_35_9]|nr:MAG: UDP-galactopyranose mutase [Candidatus Margulisbacteria bacterium GWF2_35_9]
MKDILIVGAGISGATIANKLANAGKQVLVIDEKNHIAGNCYDKREDGIMVHQYGAHIFHTSIKEVYDFLSQFTTFTDYQHQVKAVIQGKEVPVPFNFNSIDILFDKNRAHELKDKLLSHYNLDSKVPILELQNAEDKDLQFLAEFVYENLFLHYTLKQWGLRPDELDKSVSGRVPVYIGTDDRYFPWDAYQGIPSQGYTKMIENILNHENIEIQLNTKFCNLNSDDYEHIFYAGTIDGFFDYKLGELPYRSERFENQTITKNYFQSNSVINYPNEHEYTRIIEHKYFLNDKTDKTIISYEYPEAYELGKNDPYYPIIKEETTKLYQAYLEQTKYLPYITFIGRLGDYKYYDMDKAVNRALEVFNLYQSQ